MKCCQWHLYLAVKRANEYSFCIFLQFPFFIRQAQASKKEKKWWKKAVTKKAKTNFARRQFVLPTLIMRSVTRVSFIRKKLILRRIFTEMIRVRLTYTKYEENPFNFGPFDERSQNEGTWYFAWQVFDTWADTGVKSIGHFCRCRELWIDRR